MGGIPLFDRRGKTPKSLCSSGFSKKLPQEITVSHFSTLKCESQGFSLNFFGKFSFFSQNFRAGRKNVFLRKNPPFPLTKRTKSFGRSKKAAVPISGQPLWVYAFNKYASGRGDGDLYRFFLGGGAVLFQVRKGKDRLVNALR